jgi:hypothetical protein
MTTAREIGERLRALVNASDGHDEMNWKPTPADKAHDELMDELGNKHNILTLITANEELAMALRKHVIVETAVSMPSGNAVPVSGTCYECNQTWACGNGEFHAPTCILAKTGWDKP